MLKKRWSLFTAVLLVFGILLLCGCGSEEPSDTAQPDSEQTDAQTTQQMLSTDTTAQTEDTEEITEPVVEEPVFTNRLTGEVTDEATHNKRPLALMINNIQKANPQVGISKAMVIYECEVEGGITRLMMLTTDYENLSVTGGIRSSREYFIDYAMGHDAIYMHAGGSEQAYSELKSRKVDNIDGTNGKNPYDTFYRDAERLKTMGTVHSLVSTGDRIVKAIEYHNYRTSMDSEKDTTFLFTAPNTVNRISGKAASHISMSYTKSHCPEFVYDEQTETYLRFQFSHQPQVDSATGEQLSFTNVIVIACEKTNLGDEKGHIDLVTAGEGKGIYAYGGQSVEITWKKADDDAALHFYIADGTELQLNIGKTFVSVLSKSQFDKMTVN